jgi:large subunit ribosomal protein L10
MDREQKAAAIAEIAASIEGAQAILAVDYRGISVPQIAALRAGLSDADATFKVVKNSLTERAADQSGAEVLKPLLSGPTALAFVHGDVAAAAKAIADFGRATQLLAFKGGLMDGAAVDVEQIRALSRLPPRQLLYGQLVGVVASPVSGLVRSLGALLGGLAVALGQVRRKMESGEIAAGAPDAPEPAAEEEPAAAAAEQPASVEDPEAAAEQEQAAAEQPASVEDPEAAAEQEQAAAEQPTAEASEAQAAESETGSAGEPAQQDEHQAEASGEAQSAGAEEKSAKED